MALPKKKIALGGCATTLLLLAVAAFWFHHLLFDRTPGQYFDSKGVKIYYTTEGNEKAEPVILIHGLAAQSDINWRRPGINGLLDPDFRVVAFDLRGHGLSDHPHDPAAYGLETVEDITRLMDHLGIQKAHLAGYSLGGFLALKFGVLHPERCLSLAICASGWKDPESREPLRNPYKDDPETRLPDDERKYRKLMKNAERLSRVVGREEEIDGDCRINRIEGEESVSPFPNPTNPTIPVNSSIFPLFPSNHPVAEAKLLPDLPSNFAPVERIRNYFGDQVVDREAMRALKEGVGVFAVTAEQLKALQVPTICFMGTKDGLKPYALDLKKAMPQCQLVLLDGANHITTVLYGEFQHGLQKFLLEHRSQTRPAKP